jgi:uncharacterized protein YgiM (DUF1202 family)
MNRTTTTTLAMTLILAASPALAQSITGTYDMEGRDQANSRYRGEVMVAADGDALVLTTTFREAERTRAVLRGSATPDGNGHWLFTAPAGSSGSGDGVGLVGGLVGDTAPVASHSEWARIRANELNLRTGPGTSNAYVVSAYQGDTYPIVGRDNGWLQLQLPDGRRVWGHAGYLDEVPAPTEDGLSILVARNARTGDLAARVRVGGRVIAQERYSIPGDTNNDIIFLAMGEYGHDEVRDLRRRGVQIVEITNRLAPDVDQVRQGGAVFDLGDETQRDDYLRRIGATDAQREVLSTILGAVREKARDEAGLLVKYMLEAERGERVMQRFVLSGHSVGDGVWGDGNGYLAMDRLEELLEALPECAAQVHDFMIAGCYSSSPSDVARFRGMFPNLKTCWAYGDSAPGTWSGAMIHNRIWEQATRGNEYSRLTRELALGTRKGENVATWNIVGGYMADGEVIAYADAREQLEEMQETYDEFFDGVQEVSNTQYGPLRDRYRLVQNMLGNPGTPASQRRELEVMRDQTIRLIFFDHLIKGKFQSVHAEQITAGFEALDLEVPDFSALSRADCLAQVSAFQAALEASGADAPQAASDLLPLLTRGLRDLDRSVIPNTWV